MQPVFINDLLFEDKADLDKEIDYVIYCRKSTDESSKKQTSSIPRQMESCIQFAEREGYKIRKKPENFEFETKLELAAEDNEPDLEDRRIYQKYRNLYIIREQESGKKPGIRKKWTRLMTLVKEGKVKGILSYSPDRQARNLLEAGQLIDFVDNEMVSLRYANFSFEPNAAGKMMLGIWFVFSKQYSDKLGEDSSAGTEKQVVEGKAVGDFKYGYLINEEGFHYPNPQSFGYMKEAFQMKLQHNETDEKITEWLQERGVGRLYKKTKTFALISARTVNDLWKDPFYYGAFEYGGLVVDLRKRNPYYEPTITEQEYQILLERYYANRPHQGKKSTKDEFTDVMPLDERFVKTFDGGYLSFNIPNMNRFRKKLEILRKENPEVTLKDVVFDHQILFSCKNKNSKLYLVDINFKQIEEAILAKLSEFRVSEEEYEQYRNYMTGKAKKKLAEIVATKRGIQRNLNQTEDRLRDYVVKNASLKKDETELRIYNEEKKRLETLISNIQMKLDEFNGAERNELLEFEAFFDMLSKPQQYYQKATYVQKRKIARILFSNIVLTPKKTLQIEPKPSLKSLFLNNGSATENRTPACGMKTRRPNH